MRAFVVVVSGVLILWGALFPSEAKTQADIFRTDTACQSPHGNVLSSCKAHSPDGTRYAREVNPLKHGNIGNYKKSDKSKSDELLKTIHIEEVENPLKGVAWDPTGRLIAVMHHHDEDPSTPRECSYCGYVRIVDVQSGEVLRQVEISKWYHFLTFSEGGKQLSLSTGGRKVETVDLP